MKKSTVLYASCVSLVGMALGVYCTIFFVGQVGSYSVAHILSFLTLLIVCRCFPLYLNDGLAIEMSFISILTVMIICGPKFTAALVFLTAPFIVEPNPSKKSGVAHIFNTPIIKTLFNTSNLIITVFVSGVVFSLLGGEIYKTQLPECILPIFAYIIVAMIVNTLLMSFLMFFESGDKLSTTLFTGFAQFIPNIIAAAPLGYFFAYLLNAVKGPYLMILFLLPLLLARFSFKLYLDSKQQAYKVIKALTAAIEAKDPYTVGHSKRVETYSEMIAKQLKLSNKKIYTIKIAALFHDIGKIGINDNILNKPSSLTDEEYEVICAHPSISVHILEDIDFYGEIKDIILAHHERFDGGGYPNAKKGEQIPFEAAIISVADAFDAMTSDRPYRKGFPIQKALDIIREESSRQFHPAAAKALIDIYEAGELKIVQ